MDNRVTLLEDEIVTRVQTARYMLEKLGKPCDSLKLIKLIALADIYKLRLEGETITGDDYVAMKNGPAPSNTSNIIRFNSDYVDGDTLTYAGNYIEKHNTTISAKEGDVAYDYLSDFDKKCIDYVVEKYGNLSASDLTDGNGGENVHAFEAWKKHDIRAFGPGQVAPIHMEDFFTNDGPVQVDEADIERSRERYLHGNL
ncbi:MAG: Panacea domain-containing protein [Candidatus Kaiserbacteria bacterium]|nr:Panacea domain-containing protein [Candidatus Kaiserbacteria bacterium]